MSIERDVKRLLKTLDNIGKKQVPFAASVALNETANDVKKGVERQLKKDIDRPTRFTERAFRVKRSKKTDLHAAVYIQDIQAGYLRYQIEGGSRKARKGSPVIIPRKKHRNKHGNLARGKLRRLASKGNTFIDNNVFYQKLTRKVNAVAYFAKRATYKPRFKFYERGESVARKVFVRNFEKSLQKAIKTAR